MTEREVEAIAGKVMQERLKSDSNTTGCLVIFWAVTFGIFLYLYGDVEKTRLALKHIVLDWILK